MSRVLRCPVPPTCFVPCCPADFVGQAGKVAEVMLRRAAALRANPDRSFKLLVSGAPGIGKSETALELVERGHRMVADDVVTVRRGREGIVYALASPVIEHHMEIRGVGIIDVKSVYGVGCVRNSKRIGLVVELEMWNETAQYDRTGLVDEFVDILRTQAEALGYRFGGGTLECMPDGYGFLRPSGLAGRMKPEPIQ